jgi:hypothetical protein
MTISSEQTQQWLVYIANPDSFVSWASVDKLRFYDRVAAWHDYIDRLTKQGYIEKAWGAQRIIGTQMAPINTKTMLVAKYKASVDKFSELITEDPLWNFASYYAMMLKSIEGDYEDDLGRYKRVRARLEAKLNRKFPEPVIAFQEEVPEIKPDGDLEFLVTMHNGPSYIDRSDEEKLLIEERVLQFHDYHQQLRRRRIIVDDGACYPIWGFGMIRQAAAMSGYWMLKVNSYDEFSSLILADPLLVVMVHMTIALLPFAESRLRAQQDVKAARANLA